MKALLLIDTLEVGGAEKSLCAIARRLERFEAVVAHLYPGETLKREYEAAGLRVHSLETPGKYSFRVAAKNLVRLIENERPDLIHATLFRAGIVARMVAPRLGIPLIDSFVNDSYSRLRWNRLTAAGKLKLGGVWAVDRASARRVDRFVAVSETVKTASCRALGIPEAKVTVIYRGRDPEKFLEPSAAERSTVRGSVGARAGDRLILNVARLLPRKGQAELIRAMPAILRSHPDAHLLIAGDGPFRAELQARVAELGLEERVRLVGTRSDVEALMAAVEVCVFPSHFEGHGGALIEAMFSGKAIVAADTAVHRESIRDGLSGRLVPVESAEGIARAVSGLLSDPAEGRRMGDEARRTALARFEIGRIAREHDALYDSVLAARR